MAALKGQPAPKPEQVTDPVPGRDALDEALASMEENVPPPASSGDALDMALQQNEAPPPPAPFESPWYTQALPMVGGIAGGIAGIPGGPAGMIGGAALGGAAGQSYRDLIETNLLGKKQDAPMDVAKGIAGAALEEGAGQALGMGVAKVGGKLLQAGSKYVSEPVKQWMANTVKGIRDSVEEPIMKLLVNKATPMNAEAAGDTAKNLLKQNIQGRYGPFITAYANLDEVAKATPLKDEVRRKFTVGLKEWGAENHGGDNWKIIQKFANDIDAANTGKQLDDVIRQINDARSVAYKSGATGQAAVLKELRDRATDFAESETTKLAQRIAAGKATPQEMEFLSTLTKQRGIVEPDPTKYVKSIAKDYLSAKDKIKTDYAGFRSFLEDVGEQTRLKTSNKGPMTFLNDIDDVPSEKLIERMWDKKNAAALRRMQAETPEVFDVASKAKVSQLIQKSSPEGKLDLVRLRKNIFAEPEATRSMLFSPDDLKTLSKVVDDPKLKRLQSLERIGDHMLTKWAKDIASVGMLVGEGVAKSPVVSTGVRQAVGDTAVGVGKRIYPQENK